MTPDNVEMVLACLRAHEPHARTIAQVAEETGMSIAEAQRVLQRITIGPIQFPGVRVGRGKGGSPAYWWQA